MREAMRVLVGTSGYQYESWRGHFYAATCKEREMLHAYAQLLPTVELNNTFYRMPKPERFGKLAAQVHADFRFAIKAPKRITHVLRLRNADDALRALFSGLEQLGDKLGCVLFQLPPSFRKDVPRLREFLARVPPGPRVSCEFRHESWSDPEVLDLLRERGGALCVAAMFEPATRLEATADFGYVRLRRDAYSDEALQALRDRVQEQAWREVYVYFKDEVVAPELARRLTALFDRQGPGLSRATGSDASKAAS
jgi:uncharacterized protein YecE (DUF72 family)